jgi:hypothetical protein
MCCLLSRSTASTAAWRLEQGLAWEIERQNLNLLEDLPDDPVTLDQIRGLSGSSGCPSSKSRCPRAWIGGRRPSYKPHGCVIAGSLSIADTCLPVRDSLTRTRNRLEFDDRVISKHLALRHDVKVIAISVLVSPADIWAPLLIAVEWTQVCDHDNYACASRFTCSAGATCSGTS